MEAHRARTSPKMKGQQNAVEKRVEMGKHNTGNQEQDRK
uniref:Uncharacterized protein n=1 Tax=Arundo donax TaxID=35708 RepID=A0A0A8YLG5_ARUDO